MEVELPRLGGAEQRAPEVLVAQRHGPLADPNLARRLAQPVASSCGCPGGGAKSHLRSGEVPRCPAPALEPVLCMGNAGVHRALRWHCYCTDPVPMQVM